MKKKENRRNKGLTRRQFVMGSSLAIAGAATGISGVFNIAKGASPPIKVGIDSTLYGWDSGRGEEGGDRDQVCLCPVKIC